MRNSAARIIYLMVGLMVSGLISRLAFAKDNYDPANSGPQFVLEENIGQLNADLVLATISARRPDSLV